MRNRSQKTAETLLLEPTKNKEKRLRKVASSKAQRNVRLGSLQATRPNSRKRCLRNRSRKNAETLLLEPTQNKEKRLPQARQTFAQRKTWKPASHQAKLKKKVFGTRMRNVRLGSLQATRPNSRKRCLGRACEKAEPEQVLCPSHCETAAGKMPKRRFWNPLKRKK